MSKVLGFEQGGDKKYGKVSLVVQGGVKELAQGGNWTLVKSLRKVKMDRKRKSLLRQEREVMRKQKFGKDQLKVAVSNSKPGFCYKEEDFPPIVKEEKCKSNDCDLGARHQARGFLRYKGGDESEMGQGGDVNVLLVEERNDISVAGSNEPDQVFAPRMQNMNNNCFANTCLSILGNIPEGLGQIKIFINQEHQNSQDIELGKLMKAAVDSSSTKKPINLCELIPLIDSSLPLGDQEDIYPFISNLSEKLGFGEGTIFPKTEKKVSSCEKCGVESTTLNPSSLVTLFFMNGKNVLNEFRTGLQQTVEKMCSTCGENTNHKQIQILEKSDYLLLRSLNDYSEKEVDLIKEIENIGSLSLVGFATRKGDAAGKSGHWWYTRVMNDGTSVKLDGEKLLYQNNIITSRSLSDGNLFVYKIKPTDVSISLNPPTTDSVDFQKVVEFEDVGYKKVCVKYQNVGNEKIIKMVREKSMVSRGGSVVLSGNRSNCVVSGCVSTFSRNDVMLRHLREKHKMQRDDPNYPVNQRVVFGDKGKDGGDVGGDSEPAQDQDTEGEDIEVGDDSEPAQEPEPSKQKNKRSQRKRRDVKSPRKTKEDKKRERERLERKKSQERRNLKFEKSKKKNSNINIDVKGGENDVVVGVVSCMNDDYDLCPQLYCINCIKHLREDHDSQEVNDPSAGSLIVDMDVDLQSQSEHSEYRCTEEGCTVVYMDRYQLSYHLKKKHSHLIKQDWMDTSQVSLLSRKIHPECPISSVHKKFT